MRTIFIAWLLSVSMLLPLNAQSPYGDISDLKLLKKEDALHVKPVPPPEGAIVLFAGINLDEWTKTDGKGKPGWKIVPEASAKPNVETAMQVNGGNVMTKKKFGGNFKLHVEFRVPYVPKGEGQGRGNSGVYVQGRYEVQVLDSYGLVSKGNDCGAIYGVRAPTVNACKAPTIWQSYDILFESPKCDNGKKVKNAVMTVYHNGVKIHDKVDVTTDNTTAGLGGDPCKPGPILLQDHGHPVQYRNLWVLPMSE